MTPERMVKDLGAIQGRLLFFGGVYSNLQSLQALKQWAEANHFLPQHIFCTGDILGYCAQPAECIELIQDWGIHCIAGNVELQIRSGADACGCDFKSGGRCDLFSRNWYAFTRSKMNAASIAWLHTLPHHIQFRYGTKKVVLVHGSWMHTSEFIFKSTPWPVKQQSFEATGADIIVGGHCGLPFADEQAGRLWINAGVIGMPANDGTARVWAAVMEQENSSVQYYFHTYGYDHLQASALMRHHGLPPSYADTLHTGIWDNCETLPPEETAQQGKPIALDATAFLR